MKKEKTIIRYGEAFKRQVVSEIESGRHSGPYAASRAYGIKGSQTVDRWLLRYGEVDKLPRRVTITTMQEEDEKKVLRKRVRELERALAEAYMKGLLSESYLQIACKNLGMDPEDFKKKHATRLLEKPFGEEPR